MNHKLILFLLAASVLNCFHLAEAQQPRKVHRIGYLSSSDRDAARTEAIRLALREIGYIEGQNIAVSTDMGRGRSIGPLSLRPRW
jgi:hypothetical protein